MPLNLYFIIFLLLPQSHRLNMKLDLQRLFGLHMHAQLFSLAETPQAHPTPSHLGAIGQPKQTTSLCDPLHSLILTFCLHLYFRYMSVCIVQLISTKLQKELAKKTNRQIAIYFTCLILISSSQILADCLGPDVISKVMLIPFACSLFRRDEHG